MKKCQNCAEEIQDAAVVCENCNRELSSPAVGATPEQAKPRTHRGFKILGGLILGFGLLGALLPKAASDPRATALAATAAVAAAVPQLEILSSRGYKSSDSYFSVEGQVKNVGSEPLKNVAVVATWFDDHGTFIKTNSALIDTDTILPGQTSPFKTLSRSNPDMSKFSVEFKRLVGGTIRTEDKTKH